MVCEPVKVKVFTAPMLLKKGTTVKPNEAPVVGNDGLNGHVGAFREDDDHRLLGGGEIAHHGNHADHEGAVRGSETKACWPLKSVTLGACRMLLRLSPWAAWMKK